MAANIADALEIVGSSNTDFIVGTSGGALTINSGAGDDYIDVRNSTSDTIDAGADNDTVFVDAGDLTQDAVVDGGDGIDTLHFGIRGGGTAGTFTVNQGNAVNFENIIGSGGDDTLIGDAGANELRGGMGNDLVQGGDGADVLFGDISASESGHPGNELNKSSWYGHSWDNTRHGNDILEGGAGDDILYGAGGDDRLDGGTGRDTLTGGSGIDVFVLRAGSGGATLADADVITDFTDGTDLIGLDGLQFFNLSVTQGTGANALDAIITDTTTNEILAIVQNTTAADISLLDYTNPTTNPLTLNGTSGADVLLGGEGNDTASGDNGDDAVLTRGGDDHITVTNKTGAFTDVLDGGSGTDTLTVSYGAITGAESFVSLSYSGGTSATGTHTWVDGNGGTISFENIEELNVGGVDYQIVYASNYGARSDVLDGANSVSGTFYSATGNRAVLFDNGNFSNFSVSTARGSYGGNIADALEIVGSSNTDFIVGTSGGALTINSGGGR